MDHAAKGSAALTSSDAASAVTHYTNAISVNPQAADYYIKRSTAYTRLSPPDHETAFKDAEIAVVLAEKRAKRELIASAQMRRAIALFSLDRWGDAKQCFQWVKKLNEKDKSLAIWEMKTEGKLKDLEEGDARAAVTIKETPDVAIPKGGDAKKLKNPVQEGDSTPTTNVSSASAPTPVSAVQPEGVQTPASKIRHDWYQSSETVTVTLLAKGVPKDKATVAIKDSSVEVSFPLPTGSDFDFSLDPLFATIDTASSSYKIMSTKVEFVLKKSSPGQKWPSLEGGGPASSDDTRDTGDPTNTAVKAAVLAEQKPAGPVYPSSSKHGPKNWDKLASDLTTRSKKTADKDGREAGDEDDSGAVDDEEEGDPVNGFFKKLFKGADPDTRRAMMKSYQESNGTALSTNWSEVAKGPVETSPPDGMEAKKW